MTATSGIKDLGIPMKLPIFVNRFVCRIDAYDTRYSDAERDSPYPGKIISRELKRRKLSQRRFAESIHEHSQTLNAVITGRRRLTIEMAIKIDEALGYEEGFLLTLQTFYDIAQHKAQKASETVDGVPNIRKILFWDTDFERIDWGTYKKYVIGRVLERGTKEEINEIRRFYKISPSELEKYRNQNKYRQLWTSY